MKCVQYIKTQSGFTLIEALMTLAIVSIGLTVIVSVFAAPMTINSKSEWVTIAAELAQQQLDRQVYRYKNHAPTGSAAPNPITEIEVRDHELIQYAPSPGRLFYRTIQAEAHPSLKKVDILRVTIHWTDRSNNRDIDKTYSLSTMLYHQ